MADPSSPPRVQRTERPYAGEAFDVRRDAFSDGTSAEYVETADAVSVLAFTAAGEVLLVEEWRPSVERAVLGVPSGQIEASDADPADAARRELREETGYEPAELTAVGAFDPLNSLVDATIRVFVADGCRPVGERDPDPDERIRVRAEPFEAVVERVCDGEIADMKTATTVLYYRACVRGQ